MSEELSFDEAEALGLDGTGRDGSVDFPHRSAVLDLARASALARQAGFVLICGRPSTEDRTVWLASEVDDGSRWHVVDLEAGQTQFRSNHLAMAILDATD